jgi:hypothetical protein
MIQSAIIVVHRYTQNAGLIIALLDPHDRAVMQHAAGASKLSAGVASVVSNPTQVD